MDPAPTHTHDIQKIKLLVTGLSEHYVENCDGFDTVCMKCILQNISPELHDVWIAFSKRTSWHCAVDCIWDDTYDKWHDPIKELQKIVDLDNSVKRQHEQHQRRYQRKKDKTDHLQSQAMRKSGEYMGETMCPAGIMWSQMRDKAFENLSWCWEIARQDTRCSRVLSVRHKRLSYFCAFCCASGYDSCAYSDVRNDPTIKGMKKWKDTLASYVKYKLTIERSHRCNWLWL